MEFTHLNRHKFGLGLNDTVNHVSMWSWWETTEHSLLRCHCFSTQRSELFNNFYRYDPSFSKLKTKEKVAYLVYASTSNSSNLNKMLLNLLSNFLNQLVILISHLFLTKNILKLLLYLLQKRPLKGVLKNGWSCNSKM